MNVYKATNMQYLVFHKHPSSWWTYPFELLQQLLTQWITQNQINNQVTQYNHDLHSIEVDDQNLVHV